MRKSQNIFDDPVFFDDYKKLRENPLSANEIEEKPALFSLCPDLTGKTVLDLGCGYGENCAEFLNRGAARAVGIDISEKMLNVARTDHPNIEFILADISDLSFLTDRFDVIFSSLALHYIEDFEAFSKGVAAHLNDGGVFIFSQEHPLTTAPISGAAWEKDEQGNVLHYKLSDYGRSGKRTISWIVDGVEKYHRTFSDIVNALISTGFILEKMLEPTPTEDILEKLPKWKNHFHKPNFLLIRARKFDN